MSYDPNNVFARIIRGELPCNKVYEDKYVLAFQDINPQAPYHILVIPKGPYRHFSDFSQQANTEEITAFIKAVGKIASDLDLEEPGYRLICNTNQDGGQDVPHFHMHLLGGRPLGKLLSPI